MESHDGAQPTLVPRRRPRLRSGRARQRLLRRKPHHDRPGHPARGRQVRRRLAAARTRLPELARDLRLVDRLVERGVAEAGVAVGAARPRRLRQRRDHADRRRRHGVHRGPVERHHRVRPRNRCHALAEGVRRLRHRPERRRAGLGQGLRDQGPRGRGRARRGDRRGAVVPLAARHADRRRRHPADRLRQHGLRELGAGEPARHLRGRRPRRPARARPGDRRGRLDVRHRGLAAGRRVGQPRGELGRRRVVPARDRHAARPHLLGHREPGTVPRHAGVPEREQPSGSEPLHRVAGGARRQDRRARLVPPGHSARHLRPRPDPLAAGRRRAERQDPAHRGRDRQGRTGGRPRHRHRRAALGDAGRHPQQRQPDLARRSDRGPAGHVRRRADAGRGGRRRGLRRDDQRAEHLRAERRGEHRRQRRHDGRTGGGGRRRDRRDPLGRRRSG